MATATTIAETATTEEPDSLGFEVVEGPTGAGAGAGQTGVTGGRSTPSQSLVLKIETSNSSSMYSRTKC